MSYTAPQYVDTKEQAILALASTIKGEAVTGGDGSVNRALDILADVLAEQDVHVPQTDAGAILALADYVSGGGGGGSATTDVYLWNQNPPDDTRPTTVQYISGFSDGDPVYSVLQFESASTEIGGTTLCGILIKDCPVGASFDNSSLLADGTEFSNISVGYATSSTALPLTSGSSCPMPIDGLIVIGFYSAGGIQ